MYSSALKSHEDGKEKEEKKKKLPKSRVKVVEDDGEKADIVTESVKIVNKECEDED